MTGIKPDLQQSLSSNTKCRKVNSFGMEIRVRFIRYVANKMFVEQAPFQLNILSPDYLSKFAKMFLVFIKGRLPVPI